MSKNKKVLKAGYDDVYANFRESSPKEQLYMLKFFEERNTPVLGVSVGGMGSPADLRAKKFSGRSIGVSIPTPFTFMSFGASYDAGGRMNYSGSIIKF